MRCFLVSHTHWDREWYRTREAFRARLVEAIDRLLELCERDPGYRFVLDGQSILLEDYLEVRPERRGALRELIASGRVTAGPWYVQPDVLLPAAESLIRNLLEGRRAATELGGVSAVAYTPDSFGHPADLPQILAGFGLGTFVYWRGNGAAHQALPSEYRWLARNGDGVTACHLRLGYFNAARLGGEPARAARRLERAARRLAEHSSGAPVLLMNGVDHAPPEPTAEAARVLAERTGWAVQRATLDDYARELNPGGLAQWRGELLGSREANLLAGVWSARVPQKIRNRACETLLLRVVEPLAALAHIAGAADERAAIRLAWRTLLRNHAHDSICGCSIDRVHEHVERRFDKVEELARETARRLAQRLGGAPAAAETPWSDELEIAVWNLGPHPCTGVVRVRVDPEPALRFDLAPEPPELELHPLLEACLGEPGFATDEGPVRVVRTREPGRYRLTEQPEPVDLEVRVSSLPAFGWRRIRIRRADAVADQVDNVPTLACGDVRVSAAGDGTLSVGFGGREWAGLFGLEDSGDAGDTYDFEPVPGGEVALEGIEVERRWHPAGIGLLRITRRLRLPVGLAPEGTLRSPQRVVVPLLTEARLVEGAGHVEVRVRLDNRARDHRLRLLFPLGSERVRAATTVGGATRVPGPREPAGGCRQPPVARFPMQGWFTAGGLRIHAPGLYEAEVLPGGTVAVTLVRSVGWLARLVLGSRPEPAGPAIPTPGAQCQGEIEAWFRIAPEGSMGAADGVLFAAQGAPAPRFPAGRSLLQWEPKTLELSAFMPATDGRGVILRFCNPGEVGVRACVRLPFTPQRVEAVRLDETPAGWPLEAQAAELRFEIPALSLRSVRVEGRLPA